MLLLLSLLFIALLLSSGIDINFLRSISSFCDKLEIDVCLLPTFVYNSVNFNSILNRVIIFNNKKSSFLFHDSSHFNLSSLFG